MFYSHQLLARKAQLGQIWMAATMHAKINRRKLDKLDIIKICEEILNPSVPMALRLSGILMGGVVIVYERKVKLLYDDVTRLLVELNEAWKVKRVADPTVLPKGKSKARKEAITLPELNERDIEPSLQFSNTATSMAFQHSAYFNMRLDNVDEPIFKDGAREEVPSELLHQADVENITLVERYEPFSANADTYNRFERFDIEGEEETEVNATSGDYSRFPATLVPSPPHQQEPTGTVIFQDQPQPENPVIQQSDEGMITRQERRRRGPTKRKREQPAEPVMDYDEQTIIPVHTYQNWLQDTSDTVSRRGRKKKQTSKMTSTKIANLMKLPPVVLIGDLYTSGNMDVYYPVPFLDLWKKSNQKPHDSPSEGTSAPYAPEPSFSSPPGVPNEDFMRFPIEDFDTGLQNQEILAPLEKQRENEQHHENLIDELEANLGLGSRDPVATPMVTSGKSVLGGSAHSFPRSVSEHDPAPHSDTDIRRSKTKRHSSSGNRNSGLEPVFEGVNIKLAKLSEVTPTPDQELIVETWQTQTQDKINHPSDKMTDSIHAQMKAHFSTPGAPQVESLDILAAGMTRKSAAQLFYQTCVLASRDVLRVEQKESYGEILIFRGSKM